MPMHVLFLSDATMSYKYGKEKLKVIFCFSNTGNRERII